MELHLILIFMIFASIVAVRGKDLVSSLIALSAVGLGLCMAFLILKAPNLAITQLVVEILCVIILIRATISKDLPLVKDGRWIFNTTSTLIFVACFLTASYFALRRLPVFGNPLMGVSQEYIASGVEKTGSSNIVTAIALNFRLYDVLGEVAILFTAIIGVLSLMRKIGKIHER